MDRMPEFSLGDYRTLLESLLGAGYRIAPVREMAATPQGKTLFLRHDVDFHLNRQNEMARVDAECGVSSTFFVLVSGYYNPRLKENRTVIEEMVSLGHEIGLHYDLRDFPIDSDQAAAHLEFEVALLEDLVGASVASICMHEPSAGHPDFFREGTRFVHPHDPAWGDVAYISDSCRAWRDERLLGLLEEDAPTRVLLNLHGELWLDPDVNDRLDYLRKISAPTASEFADRYFLEYMTPVWTSHEAVRLDAQRRNVDEAGLEDGALDGLDES